jgi:hypothetical protein
MDNGGTFPYTATWFTTATAPPGVVAQTPQAKSGLTWYFGRVTIGPGSGNIPLNQGRNTIIGRINDGRQYPWFGWDIYVQHTQ